MKQNHSSIVLLERIIKLTEIFNNTIIMRSDQTFKVEVGVIRLGLRLWLHRKINMGGKIQVISGRELA